MMIRGTKKDLLWQIRLMADTLTAYMLESRKGYHNCETMAEIATKLRLIADSVECGELGKLDKYPTK
jgi:hypothetical protein